MPPLTTPRIHPIRNSLPPKHIRHPPRLPDVFRLALPRRQQHVPRPESLEKLALAVIGLGTLIAVGLVAFYGLRLGGQVWEVRADIGALDVESRTRSKALSLDLARQRRELAAIRKAASNDLVAIQEAHRKIASIRDPRQELSALREANEALWTALAGQRTDLLEVLNERDVLVSEPVTTSERFSLGETTFRRPPSQTRRDPRVHQRRRERLRSARPARQSRASPD